MGKNSPSVSGKTRRIMDGSGGRPTQPRQQSAAWAEAEDNHCETYNHCTNYCERRDGLITQESRRRTAPAPHVFLANHESIVGVSDLDCAKVRLLVNNPFGNLVK